MTKKKIGVLGGGQLGMMLQESSAPLDVELHFLDPNPNCSVSKVSERLTIGSFKDRQTVVDFGSDLDIITVEIEHVSVQGLEDLEKAGKQVSPSSSILRMVQDKGLQKLFYKENAIPTADFELIASRAEFLAASHSLPIVLKARTGGYDGQGVMIIRDEAQREKAFDAPMVIEKLVPFEKELSVIVARDATGQIKTFPTVEMDFDPVANLVDALLSPAKISKEIDAKARALAHSLMERLGMVGLLAVELFLLEDGALIVNEIAPRPHNSGHQTIEGNKTSQYEQHLRAITGVGLGDTDITYPSVMINLLGGMSGTGPAQLIGEDYVQADANIHLHDYHKLETRPYRKMGHLTITGNRLEDAEEKAKQVKKNVRVEVAEK